MPAVKTNTAPRTSVVFTEDMNARMIADAKKDGVTFTWVLREIVGEYYKIDPRKRHLIPRQEKKSGKRK